jgi:hypothetical protein
MPTAVKFFAVVCCLSPWLLKLATSARLASVERAPLTPARFEAQHRIEAAAKTYTLGAMIAAELGAILLLVDAFRREYDAPRGWPIAIAVVGLITFGIMSLLYFAIWGWEPAKRATPLAEDFCETCREQTLDRSAPPLAVFNLLGTRFLGRADRCATCGSSIRTVWFCAILPLLPLGSYRVLPVGQALAHKSWFLSRKAPWKAAHVATVYSFVAVIAALAVWLAMLEG